MKYTLVIFLFCTPIFALAQSEAKPVFLLHIQPCFKQTPLLPDTPCMSAAGDAYALHQLRFYLGHFTFYRGKTPIFQKKAYHLLDFEDETSLALAFHFPENTVFDSLVFNLGVDSLTTASGAMGDDLDPTKGMFWAWQSGYINFKMEGVSKKCPARNGEFQFHLGGYLPPFQSVQQVSIKVGRKEDRTDLQLTFDLAPFFEKVDWVHHHHIMSPGAEAVRLSGILANSFGVYAE